MGSERFSPHDDFAFVGRRSGRGLAALGPGIHELLSDPQLRSAELEYTWVEDGRELGLEVSIASARLPYDDHRAGQKLLWMGDWHPEGVADRGAVRLLCTVEDEPGAVTVTIGLYLHQALRSFEARGEPGAALLRCACARALGVARRLELDWLLFGNEEQLLAEAGPELPLHRTRPCGIVRASLLGEEQLRALHELDVQLTPRPGGLLELWTCPAEQFLDQPEVPTALAAALRRASG